MRWRRNDEFRFLSLRLPPSRRGRGPGCDGLFLRWMVWRLRLPQPSPGSATMRFSDPPEPASTAAKERKFFIRRQPITFFFSCLHTGFGPRRVVTGDPLAAAGKKSGVWLFRCGSVPLPSHRRLRIRQRQPVGYVAIPFCPPSEVSVDGLWRQRDFSKRIVHTRWPSCQPSLSSAICCPLRRRRRRSARVVLREV